VNEACAVIQAHLKNPAAYDVAAPGARMEYERRLNWEAAATALIDVANLSR
jgi:hypothetical protein